MSGLVFWASGLVSGCLDLYLGVWTCMLGVWTCILGVWTSICVSGLEILQHCNIIILNRYNIITL